MFTSLLLHKIMNGWNFLYIKSTIRYLLTTNHHQIDIIFHSLNTPGPHTTLPLGQQRCSVKQISAECFSAVQVILSVLIQDFSIVPELLGSFGHQRYIEVRVVQSRIVQGLSIHYFFQNHKPLRTLGIRFTLARVT